MARKGCGKAIMRSWATIVVLVIGLLPARMQALAQQGMVPGASGQHDRIGGQLSELKQTFSDVVTVTGLTPAVRSQPTTQ